MRNYEVGFAGINKVKPIVAIKPGATPAKYIVHTSLRSVVSKAVNGLSTRFEPLGDGTGFKAAGEAGKTVENMPDPLPRHVVIGSVAVGNRVNGFYANHHPGGITWLHNTSYRNPANYNLRGRDPADNKKVIPGRDHILRTTSVSTAARRSSS